ncbi:unnamed protein product [marine sediment metagenome]|uniref:Uncharacterized protein n=1 Tax=marine sediment metagenome TaxID=412755 RepID=X1SPE7_9ZZZZ
MSFLPKFLLKIVKAVPTSEEKAGNMTIIIQRPYFQLEKELHSVFKGERDVKINFLSPINYGFNLYN